MNGTEIKEMVESIIRDHLRVKIEGVHDYDDLNLTVTVTLYGEPVAVEQASIHIHGE